MANRATEIRYLNVNENTGASNVLVVGVVGYDIILLSYVLVAAGAVDVTFEDATAGTDRIGPMPLAANGGVSAPENKNGWCRTATGLGLNLLLGGAVQVGGAISYRLVPSHFEF